MYINKIYFHASLAFGALVLSAIFDDETGENGRLAIARYIFAALLVAYLVGMGLVYTLAQSAPAAGDDKTITYSKAHYESPVPGLVNPFDEQAKGKGTVELTQREYDIHHVAKNLSISAIVGVLAFVYHLAKNNTFVLFWFSGFALHQLICSPLFAAHIQKQRTGRPFNEPTFRDDVNEIKKLINSAQKDLKKEFEQMSDDLNGVSSGTKNKATSAVNAAKKATKK